MAKESGGRPGVRRRRPTRGHVNATCICTPIGGRRDDMNARLSSQQHDTVPAAHDSERLLRRAAAGDATAWDTLVERYGPLVWSVARSHRLGAAAAADVYQTTWLRLLEHL